MDAGILSLLVRGHHHVYFCGDNMTGKVPLQALAVTSPSPVVILAPFQCRPNLGPLCLGNNALYFTVCTMSAGDASLLLYSVPSRAYM